MYKMSLKKYQFINSKINIVQDTLMDIKKKDDITRHFED
jgi:hypothetical protein